MTVVYQVSVVVHEIDKDAGKVSKLDLEGPLDAVHTTTSVVQAARVARFLGGSALRLPPIDTDALIDEEIAEAF